MSVTAEYFGTLENGQKVQRFTLHNAAGTAVSVLDYGATLQSFVFQGKDIILGYDTIDGYTHANGSYIGATVGRFANRIARGRFTLNGKEYALACNEASRGGHLHGGNVGFDKKIWQCTVLDSGDAPAVRFAYTSPDGEENYPGTLHVSVTFTLSVDDTLGLHYHAEAEQDTILNLTNHSYFNVNGYDGGDVLDTQLCIHADEITPVDEVLIPTGEYMPVDGTPLDLRQPKPIGEVVHGDHPQIAVAGGIDHNFVLAHEKGALREAATAYSPRTGIRLTCSTDLPGIQVYSANFLQEESGKGGLKWGQYGGFCMETQFFPDAINHANFPSVVLRAGETLDSDTLFHVEKD